MSNYGKSVSVVLEEVTDGITGKIKSKMNSRSVRASNELMNAKNLILRGQRSGRLYRVPNTSRKYTASAPGEAPANRTGAFRQQWSMKSYSEGSSKSMTFHSTIESATRTDGGKYVLGNILEEGTSRMSPRPYQDPIIDKAKEKIIKIYKEPYK